MKDIREDEEDWDLLKGKSSTVKSNPTESDWDIPLFLRRVNTTVSDNLSKDPLRAPQKPPEPLKETSGSKTPELPVMTPGASYDAHESLRDEVVLCTPERKVSKWNYDKNEWSEYTEEFCSSEVRTIKKETSWSKGYMAFDGDQFLNSSAEELWKLCPEDSPSEVIGWWQGWWSAASWFWKEKHKPPGTVVTPYYGEWE